MNVMSSSVWRNKWIIIVEPWCELKLADSGMSVLNVTYYQQDVYYEKSLGV